MKKLSKVSHLLLGVVIGVGLTASAGAYAASATKIGKKVAGEIAVFLNGKEAPTKAIVVDGTSYLPVRWTAEAAGLGLEVKGKDVYLTKKEIPNTSSNGTDGGSVEQPTEQENTVEGYTLQTINSAIEGHKIFLDGARKNVNGAVAEGADYPEMHAGLAEMEAKLVRLMNIKAQLEALEAQQ